ncbi:DNA mismatch repair protein MutS [Fibrobacterota bacterium]
MAGTPLMEQYEKVKARHKDCLLLYRMGDFYELFNDDAVVASRVLGLTLTSRNQAHDNDTPLAGFPYHSIEKHMPKLVNAGYKVAICEQTEDPAQAKGIVKREVIEVVTRGTTINDNCLEAKSNNYLAALLPEKGEVGLAYLDLSTGLFVAMEGNENEAVDEFYRLNVQEILVPRNMPMSAALAELRLQDKILVTELDPDCFRHGESVRSLIAQFKVSSLDVFGCGHLRQGICAAGAALSYVKEHKKSDLNHLMKLVNRKFNQQMNLDVATIRNLELVRPLHSDDESGTLFHLLDKTVTAMGGRKLKYWITHPLLDLEKILVRQEAIKELMDNPGVMRNIRQHLKEINDIERIVAKIGSKRANARDLLGLGRSLVQASNAGQQLMELVNPLFKDIQDKLFSLRGTGQDLIDQFVDKPPFTIREGNMLNAEHHPELKKIKDESREGKEWLNNLETRVKEETGITTLKVGFNKVFGYYIEVTRQHADKVPEEFIRKQTLVNGERYITPEMKEWESKILNAESKANSVEYELFCEIRDRMAKKAGMLLEAARLLATVDTLCSLAKVAVKLDYCRPGVSRDDQIKIVLGRHPVVEFLTEEGSYIPNDVLINTRNRQILLLTGPNMAGKSTYLRQVALITLMAQMGSFVPAQEAQIGLVDRIFTRVGASDRLSRGQSTFMVEMIETASILHNATPKSLILLDEIGRGTSTFDGLSLAWAIVEALHDNPEIAARTLFATHYHELTELPGKMKGVVNIQVAVKEVEGRVIFLRKILEGCCDSSYGIQVAGMAGIPEPIIERAWEVLETLEKGKLAAGAKNIKRPVWSRKDQSIQGDLFVQAEPVDPKHKKLHDEILHLNLDNMTPLELLNKIHELQHKYSG